MVACACYSKKVPYAKVPYPHSEHILPIVLVYIRAGVFHLVYKLINLEPHEGESNHNSFDFLGRNYDLHVRSTTCKSTMTCKPPDSINILIFKD